MASAPVDRVVHILDFLTTHPGRGFTLSELSRQLGISRATAHRVLTALSDRALVVRNPDSNDYRLGPALVPMGAAAERSSPALTHAKHELDRIAAEYDTECEIVMRTGDELLIVYRAGVAGPLSGAHFEGQRQPLVPPVGTSIVAWTGDKVVEAWLARLGDELTESDRALLLTAVEYHRRQGYGVVVWGSRLREVRELFAAGDLYTSRGRHELSQALAGLAHEYRYIGEDDDVPPDAQLVTVSAPVFGPDTSLLFAIALHANPRRVEDIPELTRALVLAAARATAATDGRQPTVWSALRSPTAA